MGFITSLFGSLGIVTLGAFCVFGTVFLVIAGIVVGAVVWGLKKGKTRLVIGERNFDDFGR